MRLRKINEQFAISYDARLEVLNYRVCTEHLDIYCLINPSEVHYIDHNLERPSYTLEVMEAMDYRNYYPLVHSNTRWDSDGNDPVEFWLKTGQVWRDSDGPVRRHAGHLKLLELVNSNLDISRAALITVRHQSLTDRE